MGATEWPGLDGLQDIPQDGIERMLATGVEVTTSRGVSLVTQGDAPSDVHLLLEGTIAVEADGQPVVTLGPGQFVGEVGALDGSPRTATARAQTEVRTLRWTLDDFDEMIGAIPELRRHLTTALTRKLRSATEGLSALANSADFLLNTLLTLQQSPDPTERAAAVAEAAALIEQTAQTAPVPSDVEATLSKLTKAERRVADLVAEGLSNQAIADQLYVSRHTVESHVKHIFTKLGLSSRVALATLILRR